MRAFDFTPLFRSAIGFDPPGRLSADPFEPLRRLQHDLDRAFGNWGEVRPRDVPAVNLWAGEDGVIVAAELPGVDPDTIAITVQKNTLTVTGERPDAKPSAEAAALRSERPTGRFSRTVTLPFAVDADAVNARSESGVLVVHLPRPVADRPKRIRIAA